MINIFKNNDNELLSLRKENMELKSKLTKAQKVEYIMVLSTLLQPGMTVTRTIVDRAQTKIEELLKEV